MPKFTKYGRAAMVAGFALAVGRNRICAVRLGFWVRFGGRRGVIAFWLRPGVNNPAASDQSRPARTWQFSARKSCDGIAGNIEPAGRHLDDSLAETGTRRATARRDRSAFTAAADRFAAIAADPGPGDLRRREREAGAGAACLVSGQRERSQRAGRRRQGPGRLHGLLGACHAHDEAGVEGSVPAYDRTAESLTVLTHRLPRLRLRPESVR